MAFAVYWWVYLAKHHDEMTVKEKLTSPFAGGAGIIFAFFAIECILFLFAAVPFLFYVFVVILIIVLIAFGTAPLQAPVEWIILIFKRRD